MNVPIAQSRTFLNRQRLCDFAALAEDLPLGLAVLDHELTCLGGSRRLAALMGLAEDGLHGHQADGALQGALQALGSHLRRALAGEVVGHIPLCGQSLSPSCSGRSFLVSLQPVSEDGTITGILAWFSEAPEQEVAATKRQPGRQSLLSGAYGSTEALEQLLNSVPHPILVKDRGHRLLLLNDAMCDLMGRPREALLGRSDHDFIPQEQADGYRAAELEVFSTGQEREVEEHFVSARGTHHLLRTRRRLVVLPGATEPLLIAAITDITSARQSEQALRESEEHYRSFMELSPHSPWTAGPDGMVIDVSPHWSQLTGMSPQETQGSGFSRAIHPDETERVMRLWAHSVRTGEPYDVERRLPTADGSYVWIRSRAAAKRDAEGRILRWYGTLEDITDRKRAEEALRESEEHYRCTIELSPQIPWTADPKGRILEVGPRWIQLIGMSRDEALGTGWTRALHPADHESTMQAWSHALQTGEPVDVEYRLRLAEGTYRWFRARAAARRDAGGRILRWYGMLEDIHDGKLAELALRESEERYRHTVELSPLIPWSADPQGQILGAGARWYERTGMTPEETVGTGYLAALHPEDRAEAIRRWAHSVETGEPYSIEHRYRQADGSYRWIHARAAARRDAAGRILRWYGTLEDIHARKQAEEALRESEEHYRYTIELSPQIPWVADPRGQLVAIGPRWRELVGLSDEETRGMGWLSAIHPEDVARVRATWSHAMTTGGELDMESRFRLADGSYRWFRSRAAARRDAEGRIIRWYGTDEDIHDRKLAERALRESEMRFRTMADDSPVIIWVADANHGCTFLNRLWYETTGQSEEEARGFGWLEAIHPEDRERVTQDFLGASAKQRPVRTEYRLRRATGGWAWVIDEGRPRFAADGHILGYLGSIMDITERRVAEAALRESEAFARSVLESSPDAIRVLDLEGRLLFMNRAGRRLVEIEDDSHLVGKDWTALLPAENAELAKWSLAEARAGRQAQVTVHRLDSRGVEQWLEVTVGSIPNAEGRPFRLLSIWRDITEARQARQEVERARREAEHAAARLAAVLESTMDGVVVLDHAWCITYLNQNARRSLAARHPRVGASLWELFPDGENSVLARHFRQAVAQQKPASFEEHLPALGLWLQVQCYPTPEGLSIFFRDITERRRAEQERLLAQEKLVYMARHDTLTALPNRAFLRERLERALAEAPEGVQTAVLHLDLDGFKAVNDTLGHPVGDALLRLVAERLQHCIRGSDMVARLGSDEFAILQTAIARPCDAEPLASRVLNALAEPFALDGHSISIGTSVGIAVAPQDGTGPEEVMKSSYLALHSAKAAGRGIYRFFDPDMDHHLQERQAIRLALRGALTRGEFELHYQPLVALRTGRLTGFEVLMRWRHPHRGMISPADFIPVAEESGLIVPIGEWVLQEACRAAAGWDHPANVAVNLSPVQFKSGTLVAAVGSALAGSGLQPSRLQLEITESVLLQDNSATLAILQDLRGLGVRIVMDDFGTGYSSLGYLRSFPFDKIKLDRSFVRDLPGAAECEAIIRAVAGLAAGLRITTTAEGVETPGQLSALQACGYDEGQGWLFGRPVPGAKVPSVIARLRNGQCFSSCDPTGPWSLPTTP